MDYKKKYEEAERLHRTANADQRYVLESLFPELKESEDEKIREYLIRYIDNTMKDSELKSKLLSWLEKQGEQEPAWSEKDEKEYKYVLKFVDNILNNCGNKKDYEHCKRCYDWLKSLKQRIGG